jgi:hypothetical protein
MKAIFSGVATLALMLVTIGTNAQKVKTVSGNDEILKNETSVNIEFVYDGMSVGKYDTEKEYITEKTKEYNSKEAGKGDNWAQSWQNSKTNRYEPKFIQLFTEHSKMTIDKNAKYTIIFKTRSIEPGYNIGISRKNAQIDAEIWIVETANKSNKLAVMTIDNVPGGTAFGYDFDTGQRISEGYANAGKKLAKSIK